MRTFEEKSLHAYANLCLRTSTQSPSLSKTPIQGIERRGNPHRGDGWINKKLFFSSTLHTKANLNQFCFFPEHSSTLVWFYWPATAFLCDHESLAGPQQRREISSVLLPGKVNIQVRCSNSGVAKPLPGGKKVPAKTFSSTLWDFLKIKFVKWYREFCNNWLKS